MPAPSYQPATCCVCGHFESEEVADALDITEEVELLWEFHERRLKDATPVTRLRDRVAFSQYPPLRVVACTSCGLVYRNPTERPHELNEVYARDCQPRELLDALHRTQRASYDAQARRLRGQLHAGATVIEVGSYVGAFLAAAQDHGLQVAGVDINPAVNAFTRSLHFTVHDGELVGLDTPQVDAIAIWNTFDQLLDPRSVVMAAHKLLRSNGVLALRVPNGDFYRRHRGSSRGRSLLAHNNLLGFPYRWGFTPHSLRILLEQSGFSVTSAVGDVLVPVADEWTKRWARVEERALKAAMRRACRRRPAAAPWFEIYATVS